MGAVSRAWALYRGVATLAIVLLAGPNWGQPLRAEEGTMFGDVGSNLTLRCNQTHDGADRPNIQWTWKRSEGEHRISRQDNGDLLLTDLHPEDARIYECQDAESNQSLLTVSVVVRTPPGAVTNLSVRVHSVYAEVSWDLPDNGGLPVTNFVLSYRAEQLQGEQVNWTSIEISSESAAHTVTGLTPNSTYFFRVYAMNALGAGEKVDVMKHTTYEQKEVDAAKKLLEKEKLEENSYLKIWIVGVSVFIVTFAIIGFGISLLLIKNCDHARRRNSSCETTEEEAMELVPHITLNPSFNIDMLEYDEGSLGGNAVHGDTLEPYEDDEILVRSPILKRRNDRASGSSNSKPGMSLLNSPNVVRPNS